MQPDRREAATALARDAEATGLSVDLEIIERVEGIYGLTFVEWTFMWIGSGVATNVLAKVTGDLYDLAKRSVLVRFRKNREANGGERGRHLGFVIYGPDGEKLREWDTREELED